MMTLTPAERVRRWKKRHPGRVRAMQQARKVDGRAAKAAMKYRVKHPVFQYVYQYKAEHPCLDCGENDPIVLDFDHARGIKSFGIGTQVTARSLEAVKAEISKCDVVCANCHRRRTDARAQNSAYKLLEQVF